MDKNVRATDDSPKPETSDSHSHVSGWKELLSTLGIFVAAIMVALLIISFVFRSYQVDGPSMENTLQNADKLIIWKVPVLGLISPATPTSPTEVTLSSSTKPDSVSSASPTANS